MKEALLAVVLYATAFVCVAGAQVVVAPPSYAVYYQPRVVPGYWYAAPRATDIGNILFGPQYYYFVPMQQPPQPPRQAPAPYQVNPQR